MIFKLLGKLVDRFECKRPPYATGVEWEEWQKTTKKQQPIRYFLFDTIPTLCRRLNIRRLQPVKYWFIHRTTNRMHVVKPKTLKPGYTHREDRMLHTCFHELTTYVEGSLAARNFSYWEEGRPEGRSDLRWKFSSKRRRSTLANRIEAGVQYLDWEINEPMCAGYQAQAAKEFKDLYLWWTVQRPQRLDAWNDEKLTSLESPEDRTQHEGRLFSSNIPASTRLYWDCATELNQFYEDQDQKMLEALIKVRQRLD
jgi:hypothetical protein